MPSSGSVQWITSMNCLEKKLIACRSPVESILQGSNTCGLELQFATELNLAIVDRGRTDRPKSRGSKYSVGIAEIRLVEEVEHLKAQLKLQPLLNGNILKQ